MDLKKLKSWFKANEKKIEEDFFTFLRFSSISTEPKHKEDVLSCANWVFDYVRSLDFQTELIQTPSHPLIFAQNLQAGKDAKTLIIYGHYDVQPIDPISEWKSDPFEPKKIGSTIYARGASDNKGQLMYTLVALKAYLQENKSFPVNIKLCIEGEEEAGSAGLSKILPSIKEKMQGDYLLVPDMDIPEKDTPAITLGVRGILPFEVELVGSNSDLHSGSHGGIAYNPNRALIELLAKVWDEKGRVQIPGFYDDVQDLEDSEQLEMTFDHEKYSKEFGVEAFSGESGYSSIESNWVRPTFEINGISGGYTGDGFKTVIPAKAAAKISCRLVSCQDPKKIAAAIEAFLRKNAQMGMKIEIKFHEGSSAVRGAIDSKLAISCRDAYEEVFSKKASNILSGGSIPIMTELVKISGADIILMGVALPTDNIHAPNEHFCMKRFKQGFLVMVKTIENLSK